MIIYYTVSKKTFDLFFQDGKYTLSLQVGKKAFTLACPVSPPEEHPLTHQPLVNSPHLTRGPTEPIPETLEPFLWAPPFYLAPPYYPHPTYNQRYPGPGVHNANNPPTPTSSTPDPTFGPQPIPPVDSKPDYQHYYSQQIPVRESYKYFDVRSSLLSTKEMEDSSRAYSDLRGLSEEPSATTAGFLMQVEAPSLQHPSHAFNPYYHYYHHPKIPLSGPPEDPDPGPEVTAELSLTNSNDPEFPVLPLNVQQSEALRSVNSDQSPQPVPEAASAPYIPPTSPQFYHTSPAPHARYPPQPYPYHYLYYFPHIARGEAKTLPPFSPNTPAKTNLSDHHKTKFNTYVYPLTPSSVLPVDDKYDLKPYTEQPSSDEIINLQKYVLHPHLSDVKAEPDDKRRPTAPVTPAVQPPLPSTHPHGSDPVAVPLHEQPPLRTPPSNRNPPPYTYYYHPYYGYYQMYYRPESLLGADNHASPKEALDPLLPASSSPPQQTTTLPTESMYDDVYPYYYYHLYYQPKVSVDHQDPEESMNFEKETTKSESQLPSNSDYSRMDWQAHAAETGYPSIPQPLHSPYSHYITQQHPHDPFEHPGGEEAGDRQGDERRGKY